MFFVELREKLRSLRKKSNWSQKELSEKAQIDFRLISRYEKGDIHPSYEALKKLAKAFEVSADYLLFDEIEAEKYIADPVLLRYFEVVGKLDRISKALILDILEGQLLLAVSQGKISKEEVTALQKAS